MPAHPTILVWEGKETIRETLQLIDQRTPLELQLPPDTHFALCSHLAPADSRPESLDLDGGHELVEQAAQVGVLAALAELIVPLREANAMVHIVSPSPAIQIGFPGN
ncbi:MAG: hypothetical protein CMN57_12375 [Gammaproteobacteria bacterium]|nr:hypothetical protein [Gammaproteobacteria bacterium]